MNPSDALRAMYRAVVNGHCPDDVQTVCKSILDAPLRPGDGWVSEREAVERERKAALGVLQKYSCESHDELLEYLDRRYPLPKEGT